MIILTSLIKRENKQNRSELKNLFPNLPVPSYRQVYLFFMVRTFFDVFKNLQSTRIFFLSKMANRKLEEKTKINRMRYGKLTA